MPVPTGGLTPILCAHLFRKVDGALIELLRSLLPHEWREKTVVPDWRVGDVAAHLLDTALRKLSLVRDTHIVESVVVLSPDDVVQLVNRLNREGVAVYRRLSPPVLIDLMTIACEQSARYHESLDPFAPAVLPVSWAGEDRSLNWFDTARELTERWHHQQQIRLATNRPGCMTPDVYFPVLDCFLRGLPHLYRNVGAPPGTALKVEIAGDCGGTWILARRQTDWAFAASLESGGSTTAVTIPEDIAWLLFTKGCNRDWARSRSGVEGDNNLAAKVFELTAIVG